MEATLDCFEDRGLSANENERATKPMDELQPPCFRAEKGVKAERMAYVTQHSLLCLTTSSTTPVIYLRFFFLDTQDLILALPGISSFPLRSISSAPFTDKIPGALSGWRTDERINR